MGICLPQANEMLKIQSNLYLLEKNVEPVELCYELNKYSSIYTCTSWLSKFWIFTFPMNLFS